MLQGTTAAPASSRVPESRVLLVAAFGAFLAFLDVTIVNVAFPSIRESFPGTTIAELSWVLNAYNIVLAATMVLCGRLADLLGRRRLYVGGIVLFALASLWCAVSGSVGMLVVARAVQALGAAMLVPASLALVIEAFPSSRRAHAVGLWGATAAVAAGLGPPIGGALVEWGSWRWAFLVNVPVGLVAVLLARRSLVESRSPGRRRLPDVRGAVLLALALGLLTTAITTGNDWGWTSAGVLLCFAGAAVTAAGFAVSSRVHPVPLVDRPLLRERGFTVANVASTVAGMGFYAYLLTNVLWLQYIWGYDVLRAGLALVPAALVAAVVAGLLGPVAQRHGYLVVVVPGALVWAAAYVWYATATGVEPAFLTEWLPGQVLSGIGVGATLPILGSASLAAVPGGGYATASAINSSVRQLGGVLGVALLVVIIGDPTPLEAEGVFRDGWVFAACCFAATAVVALGLVGVRERGAPESADRDPAAVARDVRVAAPEDAPEVGAGAAVGAPWLARLDDEARTALLHAAETVHLAAGDELFRAGDSADTAYLVVSGRLEVVLDDAPLRLLGPGSVLGELAVLAAGSRSATVRAHRDSVLRRLRPDALDRVLVDHPDSARALVSVLAEQLASPHRPAPRGSAPRTVAVVALHPGAPVPAVADVLAGRLARHCTVVRPGVVDADGLARAELDHDRVLLEAADPDGDARWWASAVRQADRVVAVADAGHAPSGPLPTVPPGADLVLVGAPLAADPARWSAALDAWQVTVVERVDPTGLRTLADRLAGRSLGLVLAGGGARALAHVGVLAALEEAGVPVDRVAGCSVGGMVAGLHASGRSSEEVRDVAYAEFVRRKPFSDYTLPRHALARGARVRAGLVRAFGDTPIEALPHQFRCVSTDLNAREVVVHRRGRLLDALMATVALPGLFPPVVLDGRVLVDGGVLANLPTSALTERDEGPVVAVNIGMGGSGGSPSRVPPPDRPARPPRVPLLGETLLRTMLIGSGGAAAEARALGAVVVTPPSLGVGLLEFHQFDVLHQAGLQAGRRLIEDGLLPV
ncbi:MDR family MFS transporter/patatin-like phospholipase family protein [Nocardioides guangzhouensis]|uniref:MDR family MFS transporter/patatin-like phospholipase family protein n=1 Tax=Nocardioides guangzhouensis TaxID=2497878 RepID=UPI001C37CA16|nr:MDR family MFS transporter/patatin-like phospholipase family protein [Nocardioides guangzhouensis]